MKPKGIKIASSASIDGLLKLINNYFYSSECKIDDAKAYNGKGKFLGVVVKEKNKFVFYNQL